MALALADHDRPSVGPAAQATSLIQANGDLVLDGVVAELDLEGTPLVVANADDRVDLVSVGVPPPINVSAQWLRIDSQVAHHRRLEVQSECVEVGEKLGVSRC